MKARWLWPLLLAATLRAQVAAPLLTKDVPMHDPVIIQQNGIYYIFATGLGIAVWSSPDRLHWTQEAPVFARPPAWAVGAIRGFRGQIWAPDISFHRGRYYLYYAVSAFGKNTSCIGVATNATLDPRAPGFCWEDHGPVLQSIPGETDWNAIDPNLVVGEDGQPYLAFGSFWTGLKLVRLTPDRLAVAEKIGRLPSIASRRPMPPERSPIPSEAGDNAIEAAFIYRHGDYFYLFASIDYCCRGPKSTYKMIIGRSRSVRGPYVDEAGWPLARGGGTILLQGDAHWYAVGHNGIGRFGGTDYIVFHGYDAADHGKSKLRIEPLRWTDQGWPVVAVEKP